MTNIYKRIFSSRKKKDANHEEQNLHNLDDNATDTSNNRDSDNLFRSELPTNPKPDNFRKPSNNLGPNIPSPTASLEELQEPYKKVLLNMPEIHTKRLIIRQINIHDAPDLFEYSSDAQVAEHVLWSAYKNIRQVKNYIRYLINQYEYGEVASLAIVLKQTNKLIGTIGFSNLNVEHSSAEIGYSLAKNMWNKGIMTEALMAMVDFGFTKLKLNRIEAQHDLENYASGKVLEKCGFTYEGTLRERLYNKVKFTDVKLYSILFKEYFK